MLTTNTPQAPQVPQTLKICSESQPRIAQTCELRYHSPVLLYREIGFKTPSSVAGFNFLNLFLKIRELLVFVVYYRSQG